MIKQYFLQAWGQLKQHPIISLVSVVGTALAIFLIMLVVMLQQVKVEPFAPESYRDRYLHVKWMSIGNKEWGSDDTSNGPMAERTGRECFKSLTTPEAVTLYAVFPQPNPVALPGQPSFKAEVRQTDDDYWRVFNFAFLDGKPFDRATFDAGRPVAVISESVARRLFGTTEAAGKEFLISYVPYRICGVVKDVSTIADCAYGDIWIPYSSTDVTKDVWCDHMGMFSCTILARSRDDFDAIREECNRRRDDFNKVIGEQGWELHYRNRPYDQEKNALAFAANWEPDVHAARRSRLIIFLILLIVPAINLSSMTQSRLRQRVSEIGVRRAFGCTRMQLLWQLLCENLIVTLVAGLLGMALSVLFAFTANEMLFTKAYSYTNSAPMVDASILIHLSTFLWALFFCFVLNLLSAALPA
ncbi:MAG: ABC transporter permease, partial [Bacteroides sp.]